MTQQTTPFKSSQIHYRDFEIVDGHRVVTTIFTGKNGQTVILEKVDGKPAFSTHFAADHAFSGLSESIYIDGKPVTLNIPAAGIDKPLIVSEIVDGKTTVHDQPVNCFLTGTLISTPQGDVAVEDIQRGDLVFTAAGDQVAVRWMGRVSVSATFADSVKTAPVCVRAGALGEGLPRRDLFVSPGHALLLEGNLIQANALVNGSSIVRVTDMPESYTYHHIELANHEVILAEGVAAETFVDNASRMNFDNWKEHEALNDGLSIVEMDAPRAQSARQVPTSVVEMIAARAAVLFGDRASKAA